VKFGVIGIASNVAELIKDHSSIGRQIDIIHVPQMPQNELALILRRGEARIDQAITFEDKASRLISSLAEGFPYFVHLLGKEAMIQAYRRKSAKVSDVDISLLSKLISEGRLNTIFENIYHESVKHSPQREILLKIFSESTDDAIHTGPVYSLAQEMGVTNPAQLMKQLTTPDNPGVAPVLVKVRDRYFRFSDPVFKVFARIRNWKF
jgi:hypothetical protein